MERALSRGLSVSSVRLPLCEGQDLPSSKAVTSAEGVVVREHVATYAQAHGRALDVWQREWAARKLAAARARRASCPALPLPSLCRSPAASPVLGQPATTTRRSSRLMVGVPHTAASPVPPPELVLLPPATCPESAGGLLPEESEVDTVFLDHVLDFLKADEDPPPFAVTSDSSSTSSSDSSSTSDESPSTAAQAGRALSQSRSKHTETQLAGKHSALKPQPGPHLSLSLEPSTRAPLPQPSPHRRPPARKPPQPQQGPRARYPHSASELLVVPPAFSAAERQPVAPAVPAASAAARKPSVVAVQPRAAPDAGSTPDSGSGSSSGRIRSGNHRKRVAKQREAKALAHAGNLSCPVCAGVGTQKAFKSVPGFVGHLNNAHIALQVPVPEDFWRAQAAVCCCRVCHMAFGNTGNRKHAVCPPCRKLRRIIGTT